MLQVEHSATILTFIKLPFVFKIFVLSIFEWPFYTGFTVQVFIFFIECMKPVCEKRKNVRLAKHLVAKSLIKSIIQEHKRYKLLFL